MALRGGDQAPGMMPEAVWYRPAPSGQGVRRGPHASWELLKITPFREVLEENNSAKPKYFSKNTSNPRIFEDFLRPQRAKLPLPEALRRAR
jgi:hypothetical protein